MIVIVLAGLPGTGKSTLARALAEQLHLPVLDKDRVRAALFEPGFVEYSREQDDHCCTLLYETAAWLSVRGNVRGAALDGRTYTRTDQVASLTSFATGRDLELRFALCEAPEDVVRTRLESDLRAASHPARDRTFQRYLDLRREAQPLSVPHLVVDTHALALAEQVRRVRAWAGI